MPATLASDTVKVLVKSLTVTGQTLYSEAELVAITGFSPGAELSLSELRGMAAKIAEHYRRNGYFVAQAYVPAQDIHDGSVTIAVLEGRYGSVTVRNQTNLSDALANDLLGGLNSGDTVAIAPLESRLLFQDLRQQNRALLDSVRGTHRARVSPRAAMFTGFAR